MLGRAGCEATDHTSKKFSEDSLRESGALHHLPSCGFVLKKVLQKTLIFGD